MESDLNSLFIDVKTLLASSSEDYKNKQWNTYPNFLEEFNRILRVCKEKGTDIDLEPIEQVPEGHRAMFGSAGLGTSAEQAKLREIVDKARRLHARLEALIGTASKTDEDISAIECVERICSRFHLVARQLRDRRENRKTLQLEDEYDVQDLMHSLLWLFFDDIRKEEWTPSYAGGASRMDFLLKDKKIVIEAKRTRKGLEDKEIGEQLLIDIEKYSKHSDCKKLICFVYDPEMRIGGPRGLETDLQQKTTDDLQVLVFIRPTGL
jgi:hypothetical protein